VLLALKKPYISDRNVGAAQRTKALHEAAQRSIGLKSVGDADRFRVKICQEEVNRTVLMLRREIQDHG